MVLDFSALVDIKIKVLLYKVCLSTPSKSYQTLYFSSKPQRRPYTSSSYMCQTAGKHTR